MALDDSGNVIVTGSSHKLNDYYIHTAKYAAASGALLWEKRYQNPTNSAYPNAVAVDRNGNVIVTGRSGADFYTAKYAAADGALLWEKSYSGPRNLADLGRAVAVDTNGNAIVAGRIDFEAHEIGDWLAARWYVAKYAAADGALLWEALGPTNEMNEMSAVAVDPFGDVIVSGNFGSHDTTKDWVTVKYAGTNGMKLWEHRYDAAQDYDEAYALAVDAAGNVVVAGFSYAAGGRTAKYAADGALLWEKLVPAAPIGSIGIDPAGNVFVAGAKINIGTNGFFSDNDFYTAKYAADGALLWEKQHHVGTEGVASLALDANGNPIVTGTSIYPVPHHDIHTIKYASANGAVLWERRYGGGNSESEYAVAVAAGPGGLVAVCGTVGSNQTNDDYVTVVYRETLPPLSVARGTNGICQVSFTGAPELTYRLQRAANLNGSWETVTSSPALSGVIEFSETNSSVGQVFYRVAQP